MQNPSLSRTNVVAMAATLFLAFTTCDASNVDTAAPNGTSPGTMLGLVLSPKPGNRPPTVKGTPPAVATVGKAYSFRPTATDPDNQVLSFAISQKPSWAAFSNKTGRLYGTPAAANVGNYTGIRIAVSDGKRSTYLPTFSIAVQAATGIGSATIRWVAPTQNTDGSPLTNLAGYKVHYGTSTTALTRFVQVGNPGITTVEIGGLTPATWYFTVTAYTNTGVESEPSAAVSKTIA